MSYNKLGFVSGQTLKAEHLNHMEEGIANAGGVTSWNDLTDKPFYESVGYCDTLLTNRDALSSEDVVTDNLGICVKVSDAIPTLNDLVDGATVRYIEDDYECVLSYDDILSENEQVPAGALCIYDFVVISSDNFTLSNGAEVTIFPEKGTYITIDTIINCATSLTIPGYNGFETTVIKKIDGKYLPVETLYWDTANTSNLFKDSNFTKGVTLDEFIHMWNNCVKIKVKPDYWYTGEFSEFSVVGYTKDTNEGTLFAWVHLGGTTNTPCTIEYQNLPS